MSADRESVGCQRQTVRDRDVGQAIESPRAQPYQLLWPDAHAVSL